MGKHSQPKRKKRDFVLTKKKLGKKVKPSSHTDLSFKSQSVQLFGQSLRTDESVSGVQVTSRNLGLTDLITQLKHYNSNQQKEAITGLKELLELHPSIVDSKLAVILETTIPLTLDLDFDVRTALRQFYESLFPIIQPTHMKPFLGFFIAVLSNGITHHQLRMRYFSMRVLNLLLEYFGDLCYQFYGKVLANLITTTRVDDVKQKLFVKTQNESIQALNKLITIIFHNGRLKIPNGAHIHGHFKAIVSNHSLWGEKRFFCFQPYEDQYLKIVDNIINVEDGQQTSTMETKEDIIVYFKSIAQHLTDLWIEYTGNKADGVIVKCVVDITYKIFYFVEELLVEAHQKNKAIYFDLLGESWKFFVKSLPLEMGEGAKSTNIALISVISFMFGVQDHVMKWEQNFLFHFGEMLKDEVVIEDLGRLLGVFLRIQSKAETKSLNLLFDGFLSQLFKGNSDKQNLILEWMEKVIERKYIPTKTSVHSLIQFLLEQVLVNTTKNLGLNSRMIRILSILGKMPSCQDEFKNLQQSMIPFLWNSETKSIGNFCKLEQKDQMNLLMLMIYFDGFQVEFIKSLSQCLTDQVVSIEVCTLALELLRLQKCNANLICTLLLSLICAKPFDGILNEALVTLNGIDGFVIIGPFLEKILKKGDLKFELSTCLLSIVERSQKLGVDMKIDSVVLSQFVIQYFVKSLIRREGIALCESIMMKESTLIAISRQITTHEYFLDLLVEICKFTKVLLPLEFFKITSIFKKKRVQDPKRVEEIEMLMDMLSAGNSK